VRARAGGGQREGEEKGVREREERGKEMDPALKYVKDRGGEWGRR